MPVRSQMAFNPNPAEEPWRASRISNTFEMTPTGAEPALDVVTRGMRWLPGFSALNARFKGRNDRVSRTRLRFNMQNTSTMYRQKPRGSFHILKPDSHI